MHILKISTLVISLLNTKFMPCFFPCKHKKNSPSSEELSEEHRISKLDYFPTSTPITL